MDSESQPGEKHPAGSEDASKSEEQLPFWAPAKVGPHSHKRDWGLIPELIVLLVLILLTSSVGFQQWLSSTIDIPNARDVYALIRSHGAPLPQDNVNVWTKKQSGFYYCQGDVLFGRKPGKMMKQKDALLSGYRPVRKEYCTDNKPKEESGSSGSAPTPAGTK